MADLGTIAFFIQPQPVFIRRIPWWKGFSAIPATFLSANGAISGTVTENGTPVSHAAVRLYYRQTGQLISSAWSAADGTFSFSELESGDSAGYYVIAFDPDGGMQHNAIVFDRMTPV